MRDKKSVGVVFGGVSVEHEVSVITALQAAAAMDRDRYEPIPLYVSKTGTWYTGSHLFDVSVFKNLDTAIAQAEPVVLESDERAGVFAVTGREKFWGRRNRIPLDVLFLGLHGAEGENGSIQGLSEALDIAYTGSGVLGSALGMDKTLSKKLAREIGVPVVDFVTVRAATWIGNEDAELDLCKSTLGFPMVVKPARLGSSVGIRLVENKADLDGAIEDAFGYDEKVIVEKAVQHLREINCSVLGNSDDARVSVLEEPIRSSGAVLLSYEEKYQRGGEGGKTPESAPKTEASDGMAAMDRIIPAPIPDETAERIRKHTLEIFRHFECAGVARIDWMIDADTNDLFFNEINTIPGSLSFYLWEPSGVSFPDLVDRMIEVAFERRRAKHAKTRSYDTNLLAMKSLGGMKGAK